MDDQRGEFHLTAPNRGWLKVYGKVSEEQVTLVLQEAIEAAAGLPYFLLEVDISAMDGATPEARRASAKLFREMPPLAFAVLGGTFAQRTIAKIVLKASEMLQKDNGQVSAFFADSESARGWLESQGVAFESKGKYR
jgi:hypothetical protein